jgi:integrase
VLILRATGYFRPAGREQPELAGTAGSQPCRDADFRIEGSAGTHALNSGAELTTVRDNLRHSSITTTSMYLHADDAWRAKQIAEAFGLRNS